MFVLKSTSNHTIFRCPIKRSDWITIIYVRGNLHPLFSPPKKCENKCVVTLLDWTPIFEKRMARGLVKVDIRIVLQWDWTKVGLDYGEEVHWSIKISAKTRAFEVMVGMADKMRKNLNYIKKGPKLEFSRGQVSCPRVWGCSRNLTSGELP